MDSWIRCRANCTIVGGGSLKWRERLTMLQAHLTENMPTQDCIPNRISTSADFTNTRTQYLQLVYGSVRTRLQLTLPGRSTTAFKPSPRPDNKPSPRWTAKPTMPGRGKCLKNVTMELFQPFRKLKKRIPIRDMSPVELVLFAE